MTYVVQVEADIYSLDPLETRQPSETSWKASESTQRHPGKLFPASRRFPEQPLSPAGLTHANMLKPTPVINGMRRISAGWKDGGAAVSRPPAPLVQPASVLTLSTRHISEVSANWLHHASREHLPDTRSKSELGDLCLGAGLQLKMARLLNSGQVSAAQRYDSMRQGARTQDMSRNRRPTVSPALVIRKTHTQSGDLSLSCIASGPMELYQMLPNPTIATLVLAN